MNGEIHCGDYETLDERGSCEHFGSDCSRRDFLGKASWVVLAVLTASGISSADALSFPTSIISPDAVQDAEHLYPLPTANSVSIDQGSRIILARIENRIYAFSLACPHQGIPLRWQPQDERFLCPRHHAKYRPDGTYMAGHKTRDMDRFALRRENDQVIVDASKLYRSDVQRAEWESAILVL